MGSYSDAASFYGTFDQGGNVWEWNDAVINSARGLRGGAWANSDTLMRLVLTLVASGVMLIRRKR